MSAIGYDKPVKDLIAGLDATGHVTHGAYRKTSVTLHHNASRLSHEGVLAVWQNREASAHFDVDAAGAVAQYVRVNEYAWAAGNTYGNESSIHIEMCNETLAPEWRVADVTWQEAARLAGWLFARVVGARPDAGNFFVHHHWYGTACAGPHIDSIFGQVLAAAQAAYDAFVAGGAPAPVGPAPAPRPVVANGFDLPAGHYWGDIAGSAESHGGIDAFEQAHVLKIQQGLQRKGYAPNVAGWADGVFEQATVDAVAAFQRREMPGTQFFGQVWADDWAVLVDGKGASAPAPAAAPGLPVWLLPAGHYYGLLSGPNQSHGGATPAERAAVRAIQQRLIAKGYVPGVSDPNSGWADGVFEQATADAVARFQRAEMPGTTFFGQVWADDYARLAR